MFKCKLEIDNRYSKLSLEKGVYLTALAEILSKLAKCIETETIKYTLYTIEGNSYDPILITETEEGATRFNDTHRDITEKEPDQWTASEREYAIALNVLLKETGIYIKASTDLGGEAIEINDVKLKRKLNKYSSITTLTAKIVGIDGKNEKKPYLILEDFRSKKIRAFINPEHEEKLASYYKRQAIKFRLRLSTEVVGTIDYGRVIDFIIPEPVNLKEKIKQIRESFPDIFSNIADSANLLRQTDINEI